MPKTVSSNESGLKKFIKENKSLAFMLPLLAVLIIVLAVVYLSGGDGNKAASGNPTPTPSPSAMSTPASDKPQVEILPQTERTNTTSGQDNQDSQNSQDTQNNQETQGSQDAASVQDPFKSPMKLTGVLIYSNEDATAIIEYGGVSYVTKLNENVGDTRWKITSVTDKNAMLESDGKTVTLELNKEHSIE